MNLDKIFLSFRVFDLGKKYECVHVGIEAGQKKKNDILECDTVTRINSPGFAHFKGSDLTMRFVTNE